MVKLTNNNGIMFVQSFCFSWWACLCLHKNPLEGTTGSVKDRHVLFGSRARLFFARLKATLIEAFFADIV